MTIGIFSIVAFNLADTFFIARLGTHHLAAVAFTFPVVMLLGGVAIGLGVGAASVISRAIGEGDHGKVRRLTTDSLILSFAIVLLCATAGVLSIRPVFTLLGAFPEILPLITEYMEIWYVGIVFLVVPMVGNAAIRASGDTRYPSLIMVMAAGINVLLDPLLIFGLAGLPRMGLAGAALATVLARATSLVFSLGLLHFRERMLDLSMPGLSRLWASWKAILYVGVPAAGNRILVPLSIAVLTRLVAQFGPSAVAAVGAGSRVQAFALMPIFALSSSLVPFIGQNWGAGKLARIRSALRCSNHFAFWWGCLAVAVLALLAHPVARVLSEEPGVVEDIVLFLRIVPAGCGFLGLFIVATAALNAVNRPLHASLLSMAKMFVLFVPSIYLGGHLLGLPGLLGGIVLADVVSGLLAFFWVTRLSRMSLSGLGRK